MTMKSTRIGLNLYKSCTLPWMQEQNQAYLGLLDARQTLPVTARHWNGVLEYDMHNLYGHTMAITTHAALQAVVGPPPVYPHPVRRTCE